MSKLIIIGDHTGDSSNDLVPPDGMGKGLDPRDYSECPIGSMAAAEPYPDHLIIPRSEWRDRLNIKKKFKSRIIDVRERCGPNGGVLPALDQNGSNYCWNHSGVSAMRLARGCANEPFADLCGYAGACVIKNYANQGGFGAQGVKFAAEHGCPTTATWPFQSKDKSLAKDPKVWEEAKRYKWTKWYDLESNNPDQYISACLWGFPTINDYNWWSHSVGGMDIEDITDPNDLASIVGWILNSWGNKWSQNGAGQLKGKKLIPSDCLAAVVTYSSAA